VITLTAQILVVLVALEHLLILWIEMFAWDTVGKRVFRTIPEELFQPTKKLASNQGLYNGFLSAGLFWSFFISDRSWSVNVQLFFLGCVLIAGLYGAITSSRKIFFIQALPAVFAIIFVLLS